MAYRKTSGAPGSTGHRGLAPEPKSHEQAQKEAQELLAAFGGRIMQMLKAGGQKLDGMDRAYVDKLNINPHKQPFAEITRGVPIADTYKYIDGDSQTERLAQQLISTGLGGANLAARYGLPAGAAVLGAKGLADITNGIYDEASDIPIM